MIGFGEENKEFGSLPPYLISCEEIIDGAKDINTLLVNIETDTGIRLEIKAEGYLMHLTRNESYTAWDDYEVSRGRYLIVFEKSRLLDFYEQTMIHTQDRSFPGKETHYGLYTCDHIIDVIAVGEPVVTVL